MSLYQMFLCFIIFLLERLNLRLPYLSSSDYPESQPHDLAEDSTIVAATADAAPTITSTAAASSADGAITDVSSSSPAHMQKTEEIISASQNKLQLSARIKQLFSNNEMAKAIMGLTTGAIISFLAFHQKIDIPLIYQTLMVTSLGLAFITLFTSLLLQEFYPEYAAWAMLVGTISFLAFILVVLDFIFPLQLGFIGKLLVALFTILVIIFCCIRQCGHKGGDDD